MYAILENQFKIESKNITRALHKECMETTMELVKTFPINSKMFKGTKYNMLSYYLKNRKLDGLILEFGVFEGLSINYLASLIPNETIYGFDSFEGLSEDWIIHQPKGTFNNINLTIKHKNITLIKGWFKDTLPIFAEEKKNQECSFLHIDCDTYTPTKEILSNLNNLIVKDTIIVFDDYFNYYGWENHEYKALMEWMNEYNREIKYLGYNECDQQVTIKITK